MYELWPSQRVLELTHWSVWEGDPEFCWKVEPKLGPRVILELALSCAELGLFLTHGAGEIRCGTPVRAPGQDS